MNSQTMPHANTDWLEVWRAASYCTSGGFGLLCAMKNCFGSSQQKTRNKGAEGGEQAEEPGFSFGTNSVAALSLGTRGLFSPGQLADASENGTPSLLASASSVLPSRGCLPGDDRRVVGRSGNGAAAEVPPITGFRTAVHRWETQAAIVAAMERLGGNRRRRADSEDENENDRVAPNVVETARPANLNRRSCLLKDTLGRIIASGSKELIEDDGGQQNAVEEKCSTSADEFGAESHPACLPGDVLNNRYLLIRQLGYGHSKHVWLAVDLDQHNIAYRQLVRELDEHHLRVYLSSLDKPLFVAINVFHCGLEFDRCSEIELLILSYMKECIDVEKLQSLMSSRNSAAVSQTVSPFSFSGGTCVDLGESERNDIVWLPSTGRIPFIRERFTYWGSKGSHQCHVMNVMGESVGSLTEAVGFDGLPVDCARGVIRSALEGLALLAMMHVVHSDIGPHAFLFTELGEYVSDGMVEFLAHCDKKLTPKQEKFSAVSGEESRGQNVHEFQHAKHFIDKDSLGPRRRVLKMRRWDLGMESPYLVQLCGFGSSLILPYELRCVDKLVAESNNNKNSGGDKKSACCSGDNKTVTSDEASHPSSIHLTGPNLSFQTLADDAASTGVSAVSTAVTPYQTAGIFRQPILPTFTIGVVGDMERELLLRQNCRRGMRLQSRNYRSPEIILGKDFGTGIDVWSVGCTAFELIAGHSLFDPVSDYMEVLAQDKKIKEGWGRQNQRCEGFYGNVQNMTDIGPSSVLFSADVDNVDGFLNIARFDDFEKNVDVYHLRSMILLLGVPDPLYILSTPFGEYVSDFFDSSGNFFFLSTVESAQLYGNKNVIVDSLGASQLPSPAQEAAPHATTLTNESGLSVDHSSAVGYGRRDSTRAWLKVRDEIFERLGKTDGAAFEEFLQKCLQWDPAQRQSAHSLLMDRWVLTTVEPANV